MATTDKAPALVAALESIDIWASAVLDVDEISPYQRGQLRDVLVWIRDRARQALADAGERIEHK